MISRHGATKDKLCKVETSKDELLGILEEEKNNHKIVIENLTNEKSNHSATRNELSSTKVTLRYHITLTKTLPRIIPAF